MSSFQTQVEDWRKKTDATVNTATVPSAAAAATEILTSPSVLQCENFSVIARLRPLLATEKEKVQEASQATFARASATQIADFECVSLRGNVAYVHQEDRQGIALEEAIVFPLHACYTDTNASSTSFYVQHVQEALCHTVLRDSGTLTVLAYGQTSSGKTYSSVEVMQHAAVDLWKHIQAQAPQAGAIEGEGTGLQLQLQAFELRGDVCYDLLNDSMEVKQSILIGEGEDGLVQVKSSTPCVTSMPHLLELLEKASCTRCTTSTGNNEASSRSHAFYRFSLVPPLPHTGLSAAAGSSNPMLQVVDLAGNERWEDATSHDMECIQEMKAINFSLGCLKECTRLLLKGDKAIYVPYRRSKLLVQVKSPTLCVTSMPHLLELLEKASCTRCTTFTGNNEASSRSHAFYRLSLVPPLPHTGLSAAAGTSNPMLQVVDLAGNERWEDATSHDMECIQEMKAINFSLGCLKECTRLLLKSDKAIYVPYRRSKLTLLLRDQLHLVSTVSASIASAESHASVDATSAATPALVPPPIPVRRVLLVAHLGPLRSSLKHTVNTLTYVSAICARDSRAELEAKNFKGPLAWKAADCIAFVAQIEGGKYAHLSVNYAMTGKMFSVEWIGGLQRRAVAAGGTDEDGTAIYEAFHAMASEFKKQQLRTKKPVAGTGLAAARTSKMAQARLEAKKKFAQAFGAETGNDGGCVILAPAAKPASKLTIALEFASDAAAGNEEKGNEEGEAPAAAVSMGEPQNSGASTDEGSTGSATGPTAAGV